MHDDSGPDWPMVARESEFNRALAALDGGAEFRGAALMGESGVGKSALARALAAAVESDGRAVRFVLGTHTGQVVPLGAFSRSVTVDAAHEPAAMLAAAHGMLEKQHNLVVVVDDAQLLDPLSATLVYQLAADRTVQLILTIRSGETVPDAVTTLLKERWLLGIRLEAFTREQTATLARTVLDGPVAAQLVDELHNRAAGSPLLLRSLFTAGRDSGVLVHTESGWQLHGALHPDRELYDLLEFRLRSLTPEELTVIELLAIAELLDWQILRALCDIDAIEHLERLGLIRLVADGVGMVAELHHPVVGEAATRLAGVVRCRKLNGLLAQAFQERLRAGGRQLRLPDVRGRIRLAQFMMRSDLAPDLDVIIDAAESAMALANITGGEELARFALDHGGGLRAAIVLAEAMTWRGCSAEAEAIFRSFDPDGADTLLKVRWGCLHAMNLVVGFGQVQTARELLSDLRQNIDAAELIVLVTATETSIAFFSGDVAAAIETGLPLCASEPHPWVAVSAAVTTTWALALAGRFAEVDRVAQVGLRAVAALEGPGPQRFIIGLAQVVALVAAGDLPAAEAVVQRCTTASAGVPEAEAITAGVRGYVQFARGELSSACTVFQDALSVPANIFHPAGVTLVAAWSAQAEGARGNLAAATAALRRCEQGYGPSTEVFLPEIELARAWVRAAAGQTTSAREHAVRAAQIARQRRMYAAEMSALRTALRFGDRSHAPRLTELSRLLEAPLPAAVAAYARGVAEHDGDALDAVADRLSEIGTVALAADAAAQAAREHARNGKRAQELASSNRAHRLAGQIGLHSPATLVAAQPLPITVREREIAAMAAAGRSNREIAADLNVSVRTVDGHLYRIFAKLGIQNRDQLARLLGTGR